MSDNIARSGPHILDGPSTISPFNHLICLALSYNGAFLQGEKQYSYGGTTYVERKWDHWPREDQVCGSGDGGKTT